MCSMLVVCSDGIVLFDEYYISYDVDVIDLLDLDGDRYYFNMEW